MCDVERNEIKDELSQKRRDTPNKNQPSQRFHSVKKNKNEPKSK